MKKLFLDFVTIIILLTLLIAIFIFHTTISPKILRSINPPLQNSTPVSIYNCSDVTKYSRLGNNDSDYRKIGYGTFIVKSGSNRSVETQYELVRNGHKQRIHNAGHVYSNYEIVANTIKASEINEAHIVDSNNKVVISVESYKFDIDTKTGIFHDEEHLYHTTEAGVKIKGKELITIYSGTCRTY